MDLEQSIDGMVGRMIHWVNAAFFDDRETVKPIRANKKKSEAVTEPVPVVEPVVEPQPPAESAEALAALDAVGGSASLSELVEHTGSTRYALRRELNGMIASGEAKRVGAGLKTRYELVKTSSRGKPRRTTSPRTRAKKS